MNILYVTTICGTLSFFEDEFRHLLDQGHSIEVACNMNDNSRFCVSEFSIKAHHVPFSRNPLSKDNIMALFQMKKLVESNQYDVVHCHTPNAAAITRLACKKQRKKGTKVIYTAHGFHFYNGAPFRNWFIYYPVEWLCSVWTDTLITINSEDYEIAKKRMKAKSIKYVPGVGINLRKFQTVNIDKKRKRENLGLPKDAVLLLSIGELNFNKNHETVIRAIAGMNVYYVIAGQGTREERLKEVIKEVGVDERVKLLGYRTDIPELLAISDIFVFPSFREGLSVSLMETMASGKPAVVSKIRGNIDLIDENGGFLFNPGSIDECREAINNAIQTDRKRMGAYNKNKVQLFSSDAILKQIDGIYNEK